MLGYPVILLNNGGIPLMEEELGMANVFSTKLPPEAAEELRRRIEKEGVTSYEYVKDVLLKHLSSVKPKGKLPVVPKKPPPQVPSKLVAPPPLHDLIGNVDRLIVNGVPYSDEVFVVVMRLLETAKGSEEMETQRDEWVLAWSNGEKLLPMDTFARGCWRRDREDAGSTLSWGRAIDAEEEP